jgi:hypothetical protein
MLTIAGSTEEVGSAVTGVNSSLPSGPIMEAVVAGLDNSGTSPSLESAQHPFSNQFDRASDRIEYLDRLSLEGGAEIAGLVAGMRHSRTVLGGDQCEDPGP